jgi:hypothetical protein
MLDMVADHPRKGSLDSLNMLRLQYMELFVGWNQVD